MRYLSDKAFGFKVFPSVCGEYYWIWFSNEIHGEFFMGPVNRELQPSRKLKLQARAPFDYTFDEKKLGCGVYRAEYEETLLKDDPFNTNEVAWKFAKVVYLLGVNIHEHDFSDIPTDGLPCSYP